jgi:hypothetical protein
MHRILCHGPYGPLSEKNDLPLIHTKELIVRLLNLQLQRQRQRCGRERFFNVAEFFSKRTRLLSWHCKFLQRWRCNSRSWDWLLKLQLQPRRNRK